MKEAAGRGEGEHSPLRSVRFHGATALTRADVEALQETIRRRVLRWFRRRGLLEEHTVREMLDWDHGTQRGAWSGFSLDASVRIATHDRAGLDRLAALVPPPRVHRHRYHGVLAPNSRPSGRPPPLRPARGPPELELGFAEPSGDGMDQGPSEPADGSR